MSALILSVIHLLVVTSNSIAILCNLQAVFHAQFVGVFITYLHMKFHISRCKQFNIMICMLVYTCVQKKTELFK